MDKTNSNNLDSRRSAICKVGVATGMIVWSKPIVELVVLPSHATTTDGPGNGPGDGPGDGPVESPLAVIELCNANGTGCLPPQQVECPGTLNLGSVSSQGLRVTVSNLPEGTVVEWIGCNGNAQENCNDKTADASGTVAFFSQTGNNTLNETTLKINTDPACEIDINWCTGSGCP